MHTRRVRGVREMVVGVIGALLLAALGSGCASQHEEALVQLPARPALLPVVGAIAPDPTPQVIGGKGKESFRGHEQIAMRVRELMRDAGT